MRKSCEKVCRRIKVKWQREVVVEMEPQVTKPKFNGKNTNTGSYKISKEKTRALFNLMLYVESLQFNDPRHTYYRFHIFSLVSIKIFLDVFAVSSDSAFLFSVFSVLAIR